MGPESGLQKRSEGIVEGEGLHRITHAHEAEAVLDDEGWRIMMSKSELHHFKCWETEGRLC